MLTALHARAVIIKIALTSWLFDVQLDVIQLSYDASGSWEARRRDFLNQRLIRFHFP